MSLETSSFSNLADKIKAKLDTANDKNSKKKDAKKAVKAENKAKNDAREAKKKEHDQRKKEEAEAMKKRAKNFNKSKFGKKEDDKSEEAKEVNKDSKKEPKKKDKSKDSKKDSKDKKEKKDSKDSKDKKGFKPDSLLEEILELGGTEEDLKLVEDLSDGEDEVVVNASNGSKLDSADLLKFMKDIGLNGEVPQLVEDAKDEDVEMEQEDEEEDEEEEEEEEEEEDEEDESEEESEEEEEEKVVSTAPSAKEKLVQAMSLPQDIKTPTAVPPRPDWYNHPIDVPENLKPISESDVESLKEQGMKLLKADQDTYKGNQQSSQQTFMQQMLTSGTLSDKISTYTLLIHDSPLHNLKSFESLMYLCKKKGRTSALQGLEALKDLFINAGVLPDRKLRWFKNQPVQKNSAPEYLAIWAFEDWLKTQYFELLQIMEGISHDTVTHLRSSVVAHIVDLLKAKPEQEVNLLRLAVNKLGDKDTVVCSQTSYHLLQLMQAHPAMKGIVINAIWELVFRPGSDYHSQYYSTITLNQSILTSKDTELANQLVTNYFLLFEKVLKENEADFDKDLTKKDTKDTKGKHKSRHNAGKGKKGGAKQQQKTAETQKDEANQKLISAILSGLNRAFPFSNLTEAEFSKHIDSLFRITHSANFGTAIQALSLLFQVCQDAHKDRYYRTLYESLLDPRLVDSSKQGLYLNLLFKSIKADTNVQRVQAFAKRMVQVALGWLKTGSVVGMVYLLGEIRKISGGVEALSNVATGLEEFVEVKDEEDDGMLVNIDTSKKEVAAGEGQTHKEDTYDGKKRDPMFANANTTSLYELQFLLRHYHPSVTAYAENYASRGDSMAKPDLDLHSLAHFLDKFVYRNPKQQQKLKGNSIMQPLAGGAAANNLLVGLKGANTAQPVNAREWNAKNPDKIAPEDVFFYNYFQPKQAKEESKKLSKEDEYLDVGGDSELDEEEVWDAMVKSQPDIDGAEDDDVEMDMGDFSDDPELDEEVELDEADFSDLSDSDVESDKEEKPSKEAEAAFFEDEDEDEEADDSDDEPALDFSDDEDNLIDSDDEVTLKRKAGDDDGEKKQKKKKFSDLPTFGSMDDYAQYLQSDDEDFS
ncbi:Ribosome biogenesis protein [Yarrowia sp. B02]|nr:Ribosome biogenesis protein [Yarrowia sp. B02]